VLNSLRSPDSQRSYRHAIDEFIGWYCSEPRLSFNKTVVTRYRIHLESRLQAPGTINGRLAAVRRLAYEAADAGLLSPELAVQGHHSHDDDRYEQPRCRRCHPELEQRKYFAEDSKRNPQEVGAGGLNAN
jgi:hypothetical protein